MLDLAYPLDEKITIDGKEYCLDLSFDNVLRLFDMLEDELLSDITKVEVGLEMIVNDNLEGYNTNEKEKIFERVFEIVIGKDAEESLSTDIEGNPMPSNKYKDINYSLKQDAEYIYASFMSDYGIDLIDMQGKLHWYKFKALLAGLTESSKFSKVIEIRDMDIPSGKGNKKYREQVKELKRQYKLKGNN